MAAKKRSTGKVVSPHLHEEGQVASKTRASAASGRRSKTARSSARPRPELSCREGLHQAQGKRGKDHQHEKTDAGGEPSPARHSSARSSRLSAVTAAPYRPAATTSDPLTSSVGLIHGIPPYQPKAGEAYMSDRQLEHFRHILLAWKRELMEEVDRTVHHMQDEASNFPDPNDRATQESEFGLELRTRDRERKLLKKIDSALERIEDGILRLLRRDRRGNRPEAAGSAARGDTFRRGPGTAGTGRTAVPRPGRRLLNRIRTRLDGIGPGPSALGFARCDHLAADRPTAIIRY